MSQRPTRGVTGTFNVQNPDGSTSLIQTGELAHIGGRINHLGSAALPPGTAFSLDPRIAHPFQMGRRQRQSVQAMGKTFEASSDELGPAEPMDHAALQLELDFTLERGGDYSKVTINETAIMSTQRWIIVSLPMRVIRQAIDVAMLFRKALHQNYELPLVQKSMPNPEHAFPHFLPDATVENRPDVLVLLNHLFQETEHVNVFVYSEPDEEIVPAWRGFQRSVESNALKLLPMDASALEILDYLRHKAGMLDLTVCYWCQKNAMSCKSMMLCTQCRSCSYCSKECQVMDWKAYHKRECKHLKAGTATREDLNMSSTRLSMLKTHGAQRPTLPIVVAPPNQTDSIWAGDMVLVYLIDPVMDPQSGECSLGPKTNVYPAAHMRPREYAVV